MFKKFRSKTAVLATVAVSAVVFAAAASATVFYQGFHSNGVWIETGFNQRNGASLNVNAPSTCSEEGYFQIQYQTPAGAVVADTGQDYGVICSLNLNNGCSYCKVRYRIGAWSGGGKHMRGEAW